MDGSVQHHDDNQETLEAKYPFLECVGDEWEGCYHVVTYRNSVGKTWKISQDHPFGSNPRFSFSYGILFVPLDLQMMPHQNLYYESRVVAADRSVQFLHTGCS